MPVKKNVQNADGQSLVNWSSFFLNFHITRPSAAQPAANIR